MNCLVYLCNNNRNIKKSTIITTSTFAHVWILPGSINEPKITVSFSQKLTLVLTIMWLVRFSRSVSPNVSKMTYKKPNRSSSFSWSADCGLWKIMLAVWGLKSYLLLSVYKIETHWWRSFSLCHSLVLDYVLSLVDIINYKGTKKTIRRSTICTFTLSY